MSTKNARPIALEDKPPLKWVTKEELRPGDLLFSSSVTTGLLGRIIRLGQALDGVGYSHCAIFDGEKIVETKLDKGVAPTPVDEALLRNRYTDIHRFLADDRESELGDKDWAFRPVRRTALSFLGKDYAVSDAVVAALLLIIRKSIYADSSTADLIRKTLDFVVRYFHDLLTASPPASDLTCSEFLYRSFDDAVSSDKYQIAVRERPYESVELLPEERRDATEGELFEIPIYGKMPFAAGLRPPSDSSAGKNEELITEIQILAAKFESLYRQVNNCAGPVLVPTGCDLHGETTFNVQFKTVADYVSPGDLVRSYNTREIGRIRKPSN